MRRVIALELDDNVETLHKLHKKFVRYMRKSALSILF